LERLGKSTEALELCRLVKSRTPTDSSVLSALALNFKLLDLGGEAAEVYENSLALQPNNADMAQEVFFAHVRRFNYAKQQQYAMKLFKQIPSAHFVFWSAAAMLLQARSGEGAMLMLSEKMVKRALDGRLEKGTRPSGEEMRLYVALLRQQQKVDEAVS
jgi:N-terminal acetyltransferase B complex non-catalytic subunit